MSSNSPTFLRFDDAGTKLVKFAFDFISEGDYLGYIAAANGVNIPVLTQSNTTSVGVSPAGLYLANLTSNTTILVPSAVQVGGNFFLRADGQWITPTANGATVSPGGPNTAIQFNDSNTFNGNAAFTFDRTTNTVSVGNSTVFATINSTFFSQTANNALFLGGVAAASYATLAGLAANVAVLTANNALFLGGIAAGSYLTSIPATYVQNTDSRTLSGNLIFTGANINYSVSTTVILGNSTGWFYANSTFIQVGNGFVSSNAVQINTTAMFVGNSTIQAITNSTFFSQTANNALFLGGTAAASFLTSIPATYVQNTDSRTLSGNLVFSGANTTFTGANVNFPTTSTMLTIGTTSGWSQINATFIAVGNNGVFANGVQINTTAVFVGNSTIQTVVNSTFMSQTANNSLSLGGILAAQYTVGGTQIPVANSTQAMSAAGNTVVMTPWSTALAITALAGSSTWVTKTTTYAAVSGDKILADTSAGAFTITLPASPAGGTTVTFADVAGSWISKNLTIARNGSNIQSSATDLICDITQIFQLVYMNAAQGWVIELTNGPITAYASTAQAQAGTDATHVMTPALTAAYAAPMYGMMHNNILINGGMEVTQVNGTNGVTVSGAYMIDQWLVAKSGTMVCTAQQVTDAPPGYNNSLKVTVGTAEASLGAGDYTIIYQLVEGYRTSKLGLGLSTAQTMSIGFWTKIHRVGPYSGAVKNAAGTRSYPFSFTQNVADTWEYKTVIVPGDITGTWIGNSNAGAMVIAFAIASGTTFAGTANTWSGSNFTGVTGTTNGVAATSDVFQITGVTLLPGSFTIPQAMAPNFIRPLDEELRLCQRYLQVVGCPYGTVPADGAAGVAFPGVGTTTAVVDCPIDLVAPMRIAPTALSFFRGSATATAGQWGWFNGTTGWINGSGTTLSFTENTRVTVRMTTTITQSWGVLAEGIVILDARM